MRLAHSLFEGRAHSPACSQDVTMELYLLLEHSPVIGDMNAAIAVQYVSRLHTSHAVGT